jgi:hypothetical protein
MLKKSASFVLASLRGSTYRSVRLASSFTAALLDGLFEHPASHSGAVILHIYYICLSYKSRVFPQAASTLWRLTNFPPPAS